VVAQSSPQSFLIACGSSRGSMLMDTIQSDVELSW
jgi:hypothetical protein